MCIRDRPYLSTDYREMMESPDDVLFGIRETCRHLGIPNAMICIESNKPKAIELMRELTKDDSSIQVKALPSRYPQGAENVLVHNATGRVVPVSYTHLGIYAYITVKEGTVIDADLRDRLFVHVRESIGPIATPDVIHFANALPKTRSGKIMRRILRKIAAQETEDLCDISTLSEPSVVHELIQETKRMSA